MKINLGGLNQKLIPTLAFTSSLFLFFPCTVFLLNHDSATIPVQSLVLAGYVLSLCVAILLLLFTILPRFGRIIASFYGVAGLSIFFLTLFPFNTGEVSGFNTFLATDTSSLELAKLLVFVLVSVFVSCWHPEKFLGLCASVFVFSMLTSAYVLFFATDSENVSASQKQTNVSQGIKLGSKKNIIVLVLDGFTGYRALEVFQEHPNLKEAFKGFTLYPYAIGNALNTPAGISTILTGRIKNAVEIANAGTLFRISYRESFIVSAKNKGFTPFCISPHKQVKGIFPQAQEKDLLYATKNVFKRGMLEVLEFYEIALARISPTFIYHDLKKIIKKYYIRIQETEVSDGSDLSHLAKMTRPEKAVWTSKIAFNNIISSLSIGEQSNNLLFYHTKLTHPPHIITSDGDYTNGTIKTLEKSIYAVKLLSDLLKKIEQLGVYDNSLIIITADHGSSSPRDKTYGGLLPVSNLTAGFNPVLMVKPPQVNYPFAVSNITAWLGDIAPTIRDYLGLRLTGKGRSLLEQKDMMRTLNTPLYLRPDQGSYWGKLADWTRIDFTGDFSDLSLLLEQDNLHNLLKKKVNIELFAGLDHYKMQGRQKHYNIENDYLRALVSIDKRTVVKRSKAGVVVCVDTDSKSFIYQFDIANIKQCVEMIKKYSSGQALFVVGVHIPKESFVELAAELGVFSEEITDNVAAGSVNFNYWNGSPFGEEPIFKYSNVDTSIDLEWKPSDFF